MSLVWVTGNSGSGKSTVCASLVRRGWTALDADEDGYSGWVDRVSGQIPHDSPDPVPAGWLDRYGWRIDLARVEELAEAARGRTVFLCGSAENETELFSLFDRMICLVINDETLRERLLARTNNPFGQHPEELAAALDDNRAIPARHARSGAAIIDGTLPRELVVDAIVAAAAE